MTDADPDVLDLYQRHPISETQILGKLKAEGADLDALTQDDLMAHDQDHYGGVPFTDALIDRAGIGAETLVLDVCCGLGGPARYIAHRMGARVTGIDFTDSRIEGANNLSRRVGLSDKVEFRVGNALEQPFEDDSFDVVISQEAFCHVPDKPRLISECTRVLKPGGRLAFTDILVTDATTDATRARLAEGMAFRELASVEEYTRLLERHGCTVAFEDLGADWTRILKDRLAMYRGLEGQTVERFGRAHFEKWDSAYSFFVGCYDSGELGGGRLIATR